MLIISLSSLYLKVTISLKYILIHSHQTIAWQFKYVLNTHKMSRSYGNNNKKKKKKRSWQKRPKTVSKTFPFGRTWRAFLGFRSSGRFHWDDKALVSMSPVFCLKIITDWFLIFFLFLTSMNLFFLLVWSL